MKYTLLFWLVFIGQGLMAQQEALHLKIAADYDKIKEKTLKDRRFKHKEVVQLLQQLPGEFSHKQVGNSVLGKSIHLVEWGTGPVSVYLWSQMHGDEPTATAALFDIFNALSHPQYQWLAEELRKSITIYAIPMLNPDGAEVFTRRNAMGIDLNRDALFLSAPESQILKQVRDSIDADWGFNLHDQNRYYSAGLNNPFTAIISFLAPAYNYEKSINDTRGDAMRMIGLMNQVLQHYAPNGIAKYSDAFEPRAFGDNIQKWGTRTILIESGAKVGDREKQEIRKYNFVALLSAFKAIADKSYKKVQINEYNQIPFNESNGFHDFIIRGGQVQYNGQWYEQDIAYRFDEIDDRSHQNFELQAKIRDLGDMSIYAAYDELHAPGCQIFPGKVLPDVQRSIEELKELDFLKLIERGYTDVLLDESIDSRTAEKMFPWLNFHSKDMQASNKILLGQNPTLILKRKGIPVFVVKNGTVYEVE